MSGRAHHRLQTEVWTSWAGGACPFPPGVVVTALLDDGSEVTGEAATWSWARDVDPSGYVEPDEIVAFRC